MYGQYGQCGLLGTYSGDSSHSETISFPGSLSKSKKKRVPLLGTMRRTSQPVPMLPILSKLKDLANDDEHFNNTYTDDDSDASLNPLSSDVSCDGDDEKTSGLNCTFLESSYEKSGKNFASGSFSSVRLQENQGTTDNPLTFAESDLSNHLPHINYHQVKPEELKTRGSVPEAAVHVNEIYETNGYDNPVEDFLISQNKDCSYRKYTTTNTISSKLEQQETVDSCNLSVNVYSDTMQKTKIIQQFDEKHFYDISASATHLKQKDTFHMGPPLMNSVVNTHKVTVLQDLVNHKDILKFKPTYIRKTPKSVQNSKENLKKANTYCTDNKENYIDLAIEIDTWKVTPVRNNYKLDNLYDDGIVAPDLIKKKDFQMSSNRNTSLEKQVSQEMNNCSPLQQEILNENASVIDNEKSVKKGVQVSDTIYKLNFEKELDFKTSAKKCVTNDMQLKQKMVDVNIPSDYLIPVKQGILVDKVHDQKTSFDNSIQKIPRENLAEVSKELCNRKSGSMKTDVAAKDNITVNSYLPVQNLKVEENTSLLENVISVKKDTQLDDKICKLNFQLVKEHVTNEKYSNPNVIDRIMSFDNHTIKENVTPFGYSKQNIQTDIADNQKCPVNNPLPHFDSKASKDGLTDPSKELSLISNDKSDSIKTVVAAEDKEVVQPVHSKQNFELKCKSSCGRDQTRVPKLARKKENFIIVNGKAYMVQCILGRGGSSEVFQVLEPNTSQQFAVKCVNLDIAEPPVSQGYLNEIALLRKLQGSESVIRMIDFEYVKEKQLLYVVLEKGETDLSKLIKDISKTNQIPMTTIVHYWAEMLRAVKNIHSNGIIHSDLKPANFLLVCGRLKLIDFGIASSIQSDMTSVFKETPTGTFNYMSPEAIQDTHNANGNKHGIKISYKSDIWSLGCILYNLLYGKTPFQHIGQMWAKLAAITNPGHCIDYPETRKDCPPVLLKAVQQCLTYDPKKRPTAAELLEMPYLNYNTI